MKIGEYERRFRVLDMMLSGHSIERDRFHRWSTLLTLLILALSIVATMTALISGERDVDLGAGTMTVQTAVGILTAFIFFLTLVDLKVDWRQRAWGHEQAVAKLSALKAVYRGASIQDDHAQGTGVDLELEYDQVMEAIMPLADKRFLALKARHRRKIAVSKMLDDAPGAPVFWLRLRLLWRDLRSPAAPGPELAAPDEGTDEPAAADPHAHEGGPTSANPPGR